MSCSTLQPPGVVRKNTAGQVELYFPLYCSNTMSFNVIGFLIFLFDLDKWTTIELDHWGKDGCVKTSMPLLDRSEYFHKRISVKSNKIGGSGQYKPRKENCKLQQSVWETNIAKDWEEIYPVRCKKVSKCSWLLVAGKRRWRARSKWRECMYVCRANRKGCWLLNK